MVVVDALCVYRADLTGRESAFTRVSESDREGVACAGAE